MRLASFLFLLFASSAFAGEHLETKHIEIDGEPVDLTVAISRSSFTALVSADGYPAPGRALAEFRDTSCCAFAVNANFYREDERTRQTPIGLVVHDHLVYAAPSLRWPTVGVFDDGAILVDFVESTLWFEFDSRGSQQRIPVCGWSSGRVKNPCVPMANGIENLKPEISYFGSASHGLRVGKTPVRVLSKAQSGLVVQLSRKLLLQFGGAVSSPRLSLELKGRQHGARWDTVREAVSGSHVFGIQGELGAALASMRGTWMLTRQPRTFLGLTKDNAVIIAVFDGRSEKSHGASLQSAWEYLQKNYGLQWALNLDGGGSSTFVRKGRVVNKPSDGYARAIAVGVATGCATQCTSVQRK